MATGPGRNSRFENISRQVTNFVARVAELVTGQAFPVTAGRLYPSVGSAPVLRNQLADETTMRFPVRNPRKASGLIALRTNPEASTAIRALIIEMFASENGDSQAIRIGDLLMDMTPVDPEVQEIGNRVIERVFKVYDLWTIAQDMLYDGDAFTSMILKPDFSGILKLKRLPTWQMFRIEDDNSQLLFFEQRENTSEPEGAYRIAPAICVHWRVFPQEKYGQALFDAPVSEGDFKELRRAISALRQAAMNVGFNPRVHRLPSEWDAKRCEAYRLDNEVKTRDPDAVVVDFYVQEPGTVTTVATGSGSTMSDLTDAVQLLRNRIAMSAHLAPWVMGLAATGATDIGGQPAIYNARVVATLRSFFAEGVRQVVNMELACNGIPPERWRYSLQFPKIYTSIIAQSGADQNDIGDPGIAGTTGGKTGPGNPVNPSGSERAGGGSRGGSSKGQKKQPKQGA